MWFEGNKFQVKKIWLLVVDNANQETNRTYSWKYFSKTTTAVESYAQHVQNVRKTAYRKSIDIMRKARWMLQRKVRSILSSYYNVTSRHPALWATFSTTSNSKHLHHHYELSGAWSMQYKRILYSKNFQCMYFKTIFQYIENYTCIYNSVFNYEELRLRKSFTS